MKISSNSGSSYSFEGPLVLEDIKNTSGLYAIIDHRVNDKFYLLDVGESGELQNRIKNHDRKDQWAKKKQGDIEFYIVLFSGIDRFFIYRKRIILYA